MDQSLLNIRRKLRDDFRYYAPNALTIRTKKGTIEPLKLNAAQHLLQDKIEEQQAETGKVRIIVLKARQLGLSTHIGGWLYHQVSQKKGQKAMQIAHVAQASTNLFTMTKRYHDNVPEILKPSTKYSSKRELVFDVLDSAYVVATAGGDGVGRSETLTHVHASELAFWPESVARENWNGLEQCVPDEPGTAIIIESTANGVTGVFYELCKGAMDGTNGFALVFIPWFMDAGYRTEPPEPLEHTPEEQDLVNKFGLDDAQLYWRRLKIAKGGVSTDGAELSGLDYFRQEYPSTPEEAFLTTGRPVFNPDQVLKLINEGHRPLYRMADEGDTFQKHERGELFIFRDIFDADGKRNDKKKEYVIGADVGGGLRGDPSVAQVLDRVTGEQVAVWRGNILPDAYGRTLAVLGEFFNFAVVNVESNNHGILTLHVLAKQEHYPHVYQDTTYDTITDKETVRLGFATTVKSKPLLIDNLRAGMRDAKVKPVDQTTLREMQTFVVKENGKMEAETGCHDDHVMSLGLAYHLKLEHHGGIKVTDDFYETGI